MITLGKSRNWSKEQTDYLRENWGSVSIKTIARKLNRTENAIVLKARRCGLGAFLDAGEYITWNQLLLALGITGGSGYKTISWIQNRNFPIKTKRVGNNSFKIVYLKDFWKWAEQYQSFIDFRNFEENSLGKEPYWVKVKRANDYKINRSFKKSRWTKQEDERLIKCLKEYRYSYFELSQLLNRTEGAIQTRICYLDLKERPIKVDNHNKWTKEEIELLFEFIVKGYKYELIAQQIKGKSAKAIRGKVYTMYHTENLDKVRNIIKQSSNGAGNKHKVLNACKVAV